MVLHDPLVRSSRNVKLMMIIECNPQLLNRHGGCRHQEGYHTASYNRYSSLNQISISASTPTRVERTICQRSCVFWLYLTQERKGEGRKRQRREAALSTAMLSLFRGHPATEQIGLVEPQWIGKSCFV